MGGESAGESWGGRKVDCVAALPGYGDGEGIVVWRAWAGLRGMFEDGARQCQIY
jgi:acyl-CoA-binding protein